MQLNTSSVFLNIFFIMTNMFYNLPVMRFRGCSDAKYMFDYGCNSDFQAYDIDDDCRNMKKVVVVWTASW